MTQGWRVFLFFRDPAPAPEDSDADEGGDGPAAASEARSLCADFAADEAEERWGDEGCEEHYEHYWLDDEDDRAGVPAGIEREEGAEAVVVGPVEREMAEESDEDEDVEEAASGWVRAGR